MRASAAVAVPVITAAIVIGTTAAAAPGTGPIIREKSIVSDEEDLTYDIDDPEEAFIGDDETPKTAADFVRDSELTSSDVDQPPVKGSGGSAVSGDGWTARSPG